MKRQIVGFFALTGLALMLAAVPAQGADLDNLNGQSCGDGCGIWHFVNNQTGGAGAGSLTATFSDSADCTVGPSAVNRTTQHFYCGGCGDLTGAFTNLPGKLVLSDFTCEKNEECVPTSKNEICDGIDNNCDGQIDEGCK
jgi:putative metal-binding protein